jgi:lipopolysaccharide transport system permease protein
MIAATRTPASLPELPVLEVRGGRGGLSSGTLTELWLFREVLWALMLRQVKVKYKQAVVGVGWAVIQPVVSAGLFALFLGRLAHVPSDGAPYLIFVLTGMVAWTYFATATGTAMASLVTDQALLRKVYFPREVLPLAALGAALVDLVPGLLTVMLAALVFGLPPRLAWIALPLPIVMLLLSAGAIGIGLSALNVYYRDVRHALPFVLQLGLIASPVMYPVGLLPSAWRAPYLILNPVAAAIDALRRILLHGTLPDMGITTAALGWSAILIVAGLFLFKRLERSFLDRL